MTVFKEIKVTELKSGMRIAKTVENQFGAILISPGMILDFNVIRKLKDIGIEKVTIYDDPEEELEKNRYSFNEKYRENVRDIKKIFDSLNSGNKLDFQQVKGIVDKTSEIDTNRDVISMLSNIRNVDEYTYTHSINVGLLAMMFGRWAKLDKTEVKSLLYAGLLHDIGKARVPDEILNKKGKLTDKEFEIIKKHTIYGYDVVKGCKYISNRIAKAVLLHHERNDSKGYPFGFDKEKIPFLARVLAIVDTYDAMTSDRVYRGHRPPFTVFKLFENDLHSYDLLLSKIFMSNISQYYLGEMVQLTNGKMGEIVYINHNCISKPIIKVGPRYIDLSNSDLEITTLMVKSQFADELTTNSI